MRYLKYILAVIIWVSGFSYQSRAQAIKVEAKLDKPSILIGDQTQLHLSIRFPAKDSVSFPKLQDSIGKIQIVQMKADTSFDKNDISIETIHRSYTITGFDSGSYVIPAYEFHTKSGVFKTEGLLLQVQPVAVDTTKAIYDIKQPFNVSYSWRDWIRDNWPWVVFPLLAAILVAGMIYYIKKRPKKQVVVKPAGPAKPAHVIALDKLYALRDQKLWQQEQTKLYHSELSDVVREYIERRYQVNASEQTTDEILSSLRYRDIAEENRNQLRQILILADLVKFAKERPLPSDNEESMNNAINFVMKTQLQVIQPINNKEGNSDELV